MGLINYLGPILAMLNEAFRHMVDFGTGHFTWAQDSTYVYAYGGARAPSQYQWVLGGNMPALTPKGEDIIASVMTIVHYGLAALAQFVTLLPANGLSPLT